MIEYETLIIILIIGVLSLIITLLLFFTGKKVEIKEKQGKDISNVKIFNTKIKLIPFLYLLIIIIMFIIGIFSDFLINSIIGFIIALIPFFAYWIFDFNRD